MTGGVIPNLDYINDNITRTAGVYVSLANNVRLLNNRFENGVPAYDADAPYNYMYNTAVRTTNASALDMEHNAVISGFDTGLYVGNFTVPGYDTSNYHIVSNNVFNTMYGMELDFSSNNTVSNNIFNSPFPTLVNPSGGTIGVMAYGADNSVFTDNVWNGYEYGGFFFGTSNLSMTGGGINADTSTNPQIGLYLDGTNNLIQVPVNGYATALYTNNPLASGSYTY